MRTMIKPLVLAAGVTLLGAGLATAADHLILGKLLLVKEPKLTEASRVVKVISRELNSPNDVVGDPTIGGATARIVVHGATNSDATFPLPAAGWVAKSVGYKYKDLAGTYGPVKAAAINKTGTTVFHIKIVAYGALGPVPIVPPDPGTDGGLVFTIAGGDTYCSNFGGDAGGQLVDAGSKFLIRKPTAETACLP
jgi:hypothetical protein